MDKKVLMIFTGGTIAMKVDEKLDAAVPGVESNELVNMVKDVNSFTDIETIDFANIPSPHMTPGLMLDLGKLVLKNIVREDITGIVITHGTDTLEETAYILDLMVESEKPIILVGSMRNNSELGYDGAANIWSAIFTACSEEAKGKGVLVVMDDEIHAARYVTKTNTVSTDTFKSPELGPIGVLSNGKTLFYMESIKRQHIDTDTIEEKVALIKAVAGMDGDIIDFYVDKGYKGLVIEALGCGNLPPAMVASVKRAIKKDIPVVLVSRCINGAVEPVYGYEGGGSQLKDMGVIFGGNQSGQKTRIKLMQLLGKTKDINEIREAFLKLV
ncbi:MAG TPA: asparaginase [Tissierellaceae bacterium]|nr:asparaginase [Tissierellaceae bacterium]